MSVVGQSTTGRRALCDAFAVALSYPYDPPTEALRRTAALAGELSAEAAGLLEGFACLTEELGLGVLQEEYTRAFDLDTLSRAEPTCHPYVGHYLFEETHKRGALILGLRKRFRAAGFADESDLADHVVVLLRFLAHCDEDDVTANEIVDDALLPALARIEQLAAAGDPGSPVRQGYVDVLRALALALRTIRPEPAVEPADAELEREWIRNRDSLGIDRASCGH